MTPSQKIKHAIILKAFEWLEEDIPAVNSENIDDLYNRDDISDYIYDAESEIRCSGVETGLDCLYSRHYESKSLGMKMPDGSWVGWTYWYGGGKHGEPEAIDWIEDAYDLECEEKEEMVITRSFTAKTVDLKES